MELTAYLHPGWTPLIRPAPAGRAWMDATPESFAYRCLPLNIANAHGWEVLTPFGFEAVWDGGAGTDAVTIAPDPDAAPARAPVSLFGQGVLTFHIEAILRTPPGWDLWVGGSPNRQKDGIAPLTGVVETDWSPFTFTMNWRFTRPGHTVRFEAMEPFCFLFPVQRGAVEAFAPKFAPLGADPETEKRFRAWSEARDAFHAKMQREPPEAPADRWQKHYYRGTDVTGEVLAPGHRAKLRLKPFDRTAAPQVPAPPAEDLPQAAQHTAPGAPVTADGEEIAALRTALAKREWLLETLERQRALAPAAAGIPRRENLGADEFLEHYYAVNRPVILVGEMADWPALARWTPDYLKAAVGAATVEYQGGRTGNARFEMEKDLHRREGPFDAFMDQITRVDGNDAYITAYNSARNREALAPLSGDMGTLDKFLTTERPAAEGMMWIGPAGTATSLHHDLTNNFIGQLVGRKRLQILPASEVGRLYNDRHVFSRIADLEDPGLDAAHWPRLPGAHVYEVILEPGEILFMPLAWWHQVKALDFSVTVTWTNFRWPNDGHASYPPG
ncbi:DUF6065 family protein [Emcibacter sp. SYSU 3D8]|uniref:DUF6065 family protein n=1 Tax=Emcibacter sp. SYSU 3D8 TaxID=3133969 RepID=UPI0031FF3546